ncbi:MAG: Asp-tRNA(Asn)/Glu-tRNA(Gln) amidotransferase subunit GatC [Calditrichaeota bacterium]|nr:MAG: Asp-tRNA(Asn)/Glu-tRNA(Gln) amidotransferase subunit GatC [Calditrichota bacterium]
MAISKEEILKVAQLAKLEFSEEELKTFDKDLNKILGYIEQLEEVDTSGVETLDSINPTENVLRKDENIPSLTKEQSLQNAPEKQNGFFKVPKVVQEGN